jgi:hypothetical protein
LLAATLERVLERGFNCRIITQIRSDKPYKQQVLCSLDPKPNIFDSAWPRWSRPTSRRTADNFAAFKVDQKARLIR